MQIPRYDVWGVLTDKSIDATAFSPELHVLMISENIPIVRTD
jgi:hypothetical protein